MRQDSLLASRCSGPLSIALALSVALHCDALVRGADPFGPFGTALEDGTDLSDVAHSCDVDAVQEANVRQLHPILYDLVNTTFFRLFRVRLKNPSCAFWQKPGKEEDQASSGTCTGSVPSALGAGNPFATFGMSTAAPPFGAPSAPPGEPPCSIDAEGGGGPKGEPDRLDRSMTRAERMAVDEAIEARRLEGSAECAEDLPAYFFDMCSDDSSESGAEDVNLVKNPERNTGYNGSHIWESMYNENCFEVGSGLPRGRFRSATSGMCYEERVLWRLLSGWHASTTIAIAKNFYAPGTKGGGGSWAPNPDMFMRSLGTHPEWLKNLHFSFVVMLRAIKKAGSFLRLYQYSTGDEKEDVLTNNLINRFLDSQVLTVCSPLFEAFDETKLFKGSSVEHRSLLKRQFKSVFRNITVVVDCVQCQRCRLHAKLFSLGLGSALKILLTPPELIGQTTTRDEVVALLNVCWKLSEAMEDARLLTKLYWSEQEAKRGQEKPEPVTAPSTTGGEGSSTGSTTSTNPAGVGQPPRSRATQEADTSWEAGDRRALLDVALGAVRRAASSGALSSGAEEAVLRSLVVRPASDAVLLLAKHYAKDRPELFATLANEAASSGPWTEVTSRPSAPALAAPLGSAAAAADAVVIGGGLAGMVATITLLDRGASVVMIEKQAYLGGNSGKASSGINAALETSVESLVKDTTKSAGSLARPALIDRLAIDSAPHVDWLRNRISVDLSMRSQLGGHTVKRTLRPSNAFVGAEITFAAGQVLKAMALDRPHQFRLLTNSKWTGLQQGGAGWRATLTANGTEVVVEARSAIIASGGFGHDAKEVESYLLQHRPDLKDFPTTLGPQTTGDGLKIAKALGAKLVDMDRVQLHPTGFVDRKKPQESLKTLAAELLRGVGGLLLDRNGRRFTDELGTRQAAVNSELAATKEGRNFPPPLPDRSFALVLNGKAAAMADRHTTLYSKKGLLTKVQGFDGIADYLNVSVDALHKTFGDYNEAARAGHDAFNRTVFPAGHWPVEEDEEFLVGFIVPVIHYTMGGIAIDPDAHVLSESDEQPIPGLYAIGEASGGVHGDNRLAGNSLLECTVFGRHVGLTLPVAQSQQSSLVAEAGSAADVPGMTEAAVSSTKPENGVPVISAEELSKHKTREQRTWVALYGQVYDLTDYIDEHPGGPEAVTDVAGIDGTEHFAAVHNREMLESMGFEPIGTLAG